MKNKVMDSICLSKVIMTRRRTRKDKMTTDDGEMTDKWIWGGRKGMRMRERS